DLPGHVFDGPALPALAQALVHEALMLAAGQALDLLGRELEERLVPVRARRNEGVDLPQLGADVLGLPPVGLLEVVGELVPGLHRRVRARALAAAPLIPDVLLVDGPRQDLAGRAEGKPWLEDAVEQAERLELERSAARLLAAAQDLEQPALLLHGEGDRQALSAEAAEERQRRGERLGLVAQQDVGAGEGDAAPVIEEKGAFLELRRRRIEREPRHAAMLGEPRILGGEGVDP